MILEKRHCIYFFRLRFSLVLFGISIKHAFEVETADDFAAAVEADVELEAVGGGLDLVTVVGAEDKLAVAWGAAVELDVAELVPVTTVGVVAQNKFVLVAFGVEVAEAAVDVLVLGVGPVGDVG